MRKALCIVSAVALAEFALILYLVFSSTYEPRYADHFPGEMQTELRVVAEELLASPTLKDEQYYRAKDLKMSETSLSTLSKYDIRTLRKENGSVYFTLDGWIDDEWGVVYSANGGPTWSGVKSMKLLGGNFYEFSSMY